MKTVRFLAHIFFYLKTLNKWKQTKTRIFEIRVRSYQQLCVQSSGVVGGELAANMSTSACQRRLQWVCVCTARRDGGECGRVAGHAVRARDLVGPTQIGLATTTTTTICSSQIRNRFSFRFRPIEAIFSLSLRKEIQNEMFNK